MMYTLGLIAMENASLFAQTMRGAERKTAARKAAAGA